MSLLMAPQSPTKAGEPLCFQFTAQLKVEDILDHLDV